MRSATRAWSAPSEELKRRELRELVGGVAGDLLEVVVPALETQRLVEQVGDPRQTRQHRLAEVLLGEQVPARLLAVADVGNGRDEVQRRSGAVPQQAGVDVGPDDMPVTMEVALLHVIAVALAGDEAANALSALRNVVRMRDASEVELLQLGDCVTKHLGEGAVDLQQPAVRRGQRLAHPRVFENGAVALLRLLHPAQHRRGDPDEGERAEGDEHQGSEQREAAGAHDRRPDLSQVDLGDQAPVRSIDRSEGREHRLPR